MKKNKFQKIKDTKTAVSKANVKAADEQDAFIGGANGKLLGDNQYQCWITFWDGSEVLAINQKCPNIPGYPVKVKFRDGHYYITKPKQPYTESLQETPAHAPTHGRLGSDPDWVSNDRILTDLLAPIPGGLTLQYYGGVYDNGTSAVSVLARVVDMTSHLPATAGYARWCRVEKTSAGALNIVDGTAKKADELLLSDIPAATVGNQSIWAVKCVQGTTEIIYSKLTKQLIDLRYLSTSGTVTGSGTSGKLVKWTGTASIGDATNTDAQVSGHLSSTSNPHSTTAAQVGAPALVNPSVADDIVTFSSTAGAQKDSGTKLSALLHADGSVNANYVPLANTYTPTGSEPVGAVYWDSTLNNGSGGICVVYPNGKILNPDSELWIHGKNVSGSIIHSGDAVAITSAAGSWTALTLADATTPSAYAFVGIATEQIAINGFGSVCISGEVHDVDTSGYDEGKPVYIDPANPGHLTKTYPTPPNYIVNAGIVTYKHAMHGIINVATLIQPRLSDLSDVSWSSSKTTPVDADAMLLYDSVAVSVWKKLTWANIKATLKTYFDGIYQAVLSNPVTGTGTSGTLTKWTGTGTVGNATNTDAQVAAAVTAASTTATLFVDWKDPTGFVDNENIVRTYDSTTRKITLSHASGHLYYYWYGVKYDLGSPWVSSAHTNSAGIWFLSSSDGVNFTWSTTPWTFSVIQAAIVNFGASDKYGLSEVHGLMQWTVHEELHEVIGCFRESGGALSGYVLSSTTAANRRPDISATILQDEDNHTTLDALTSKLYTKFFLTSAGTNNYTVETADIVPLSGANPYYNQFTGGAWQQTLMSNNSYMSVWLLAVPTTSDTTSKKYRYLWVQGQSNGTLAAEQALTPASLSLGTLSAEIPEFSFIAQIILRYQSSNWDINSVIVLGGTKYSQTSTPATITASAVTFTPDGSIAATNVQAAIVEVRDEAQPLNTNLTAIAGLSPSNDDIIQRKAGAWTNRTVSQYVTDLLTVLVPTSVREKLSAARTYYVRTDGNDANTGLVNTAGGAFLTIQRGITVAQTLDTNGYGVTIQIADGTYTGAISYLNRLVGGGLLTLSGNATTPANVVISVSGTAVTAGNGVNMSLSGLKITNSGSGDCLSVLKFSTVTLDGKMEFGASAQAHIHASYSGQISVNADYTVSGSATYHWWSETAGSSITCVLRTITLSGTPAFTTFARASVLCQIYALLNTYSGSATGQRYNVDYNAVIYTSGATLPGNSAGASSNGGIYS